MKHLLTLFTVLFVSVSVAFATDYTVETTPAPATPVLSAVLPLVPQTSTASSVTQQVFLASELTALGATAGDITGITFYYGGKSNNTAVPSVTRSIKIFISSVAADSIAIHEISGYITNYRAKFLNPGTSPVYDGSITTEAIAVGEVKPLSIIFNQSSFAWDGTSNILLTVFDVTNTAYSSTEANLRFVLKATEHARFAHQLWTVSGDNKASDYLSSLAGLEAYSYTSGSTGTAKDKQVRGHLWVTKTTFTIEPSAAPTVPPVPADLAASSVGVTTASLSWTASTGATSYALAYSTDGSVYSELATPSDNSYAWSGLTANTTYYVKVAAVNEVGTSDYSAPISFTTLAPHTHDGITFEPWFNASAMPTSGNYYLATDVAYDFYEGGYLNLNGNLNLCLNGHIINLGTKSINVTNGKTMTIYDAVGGGKITGFVPGQDGIYTYMGVISVENNGTLVLRQGEVENTYPNDDPDYKSITIAVGGTLILSGAPIISSNEIDIYLPPTIPAKVITIESGKPITNSTPYKVYKMDGVFTSGWANMGGANPTDFFISANPDRVVSFNGSEAELVYALSLDENSSSNETNISSQLNQLVNVNMTRSTLTSASFNTICLPFNLTNDQLQDIFGSGYDLKEFTSSELNDEELVLTFSPASALQAGKPYLIKPSVNVSNPVFEGVTISVYEPLSQTSDTYISFIGVFNPTELEGGNKNILFLGANNELFWPEATGNIKGFRAYFEVKGDARKAVRARIAQQSESTEAVINISADNKAQKVIRDGQLYLMFEGRMYNVQGQRIQ